MKKSTSVLTLLLILLAIYWSFKSQLPTYSPDNDKPNTEFSTDRALIHVKTISQEPHGVGFDGHEKVKNYIIAELNTLGLETSVQQGYTAGDWANLSKADNILARIKGTQEGKALLLLTHYDSSPHSSLGASDAGSGVATILEGTRAFLAQNKQPKNDIIILITDAEELGLNGADLFVKNHPWAKEVGLVLNFEARGSGGPGYMLMETNRGNGNLIKEFMAASPAYPVANSLAYSIYKMLPNDTDLTVFRKDGDIEGFNFAFIDDHFDYHTVRDNFERLDKNTLAHQGSYLMPLLSHFSEVDLSQMKSLNDYVYFNIPFFKMISYPFEWVWPMFGLAVLLFMVFLIIGVRKNVLNTKDMLKGFLPLLIALTVNGLVGFYSWTALKWIYPSYADMLHGFTYNGHAYILAFALFSVGVCFYAYHTFRVVKTPNLLVAPIFIWLVVCGLAANYLPGAAFFVVPVFGILVALYILIHQKNPNAMLLVFLGIPALFIFAPLVKMFPVGLGLKMMVAATVFTTLTFFLLLPVFTRYKNQLALALLSFLLCIGFLVSAHMSSGFTPDRARPTSLLYVMDLDTKTAKWATYDQTLSDWTARYIGANKTVPEELSENTISSKYGSGFTYVSEADLKNISGPTIEKLRDTIIGDTRLLDFCITPQRNVNRLELFTNDITIKKATINDIPLSDYFLKNRNRGKLVTHYISNNDYTDIVLEIPKDAVLELTIFEASNDLLSSEQFSVPKRPENNIPMPFILNDAILTTQTIAFE
jgi:hypothetical protein